MIADVRDRLLAVPFIAFVTPQHNRVVVVADDGATAIRGPLHINSIIDQQPNGG